MNPMLLQFFGLRDQPFGVTPDPRFLYESRTHREALASMLYGLSSERGFLALVGKPGMGKTTLLFRLLEQYRHSALTAFLFQTQCDSREFLSYLFADLGVDCPDPNNLVIMHQRFNEMLEDRAHAGQRCIIVIDEAQNLDNRVLETVRLLSDFETSRTKLLQIIIAGQPALGEKLADPSLSQLRQRISLLCRLTPLSQQEVDEYIAYRLRMAGYKGDKLFSPEARARIATMSEGIPRVISNICFNAMSLAYAMGQKEVTPALIDEIGTDLGLEALAEKDATTGDPAHGVSTPREHPARVEAAVSGRREDEVTSQHAASADQARGFPPSDNNAAPTTVSPVQSGFSTFPSISGTVAAPAKAREVVLDRPRGAGSTKRRIYPVHLVEQVVITLACGAVVIAVALWFAHGTQGQATVSHTWNSESPSAVATKASPQSDRAGNGSPPALFANDNSHGQFPAGEADHDVAQEKSKAPGQKPQHDLNSAGITLSIHRPHPLSRLHAEEETAPPAISERPELPGLTLSRHSAGPEFATPVPTPPGSTSNEPIPGRITSLVQPVYPDAARSAAIEGTVVLQALVDRSGIVRNVRVLEGKPLLADAAVQAVRHWRYRPYLENGNPAMFQTIIKIQFVLDGAAPKS